MKKLMFIFVLFLFLVNCSEEPTIVDPELQPFVDTFKQEAAKRGVKFNIADINVQLKENLTVYDGVKHIKCSGVHYKTKHGRQIYIDKQYYDTSAYWCVERTVFHEFGHAMGRSHQDIGNSIMNLRRPDLLCYHNDADLREQLIDELFDNR